MYYYYGVCRVRQHVTVALLTLVACSTVAVVALLASTMYWVRACLGTGIRYVLCCYVGGVPAGMLLVEYY